MSGDFDDTCLFCKIVAGQEPSKKVYETADFLVIENKFPIAPIHVLVLDKKHREKKKTISGTYSSLQLSYWDKMFEAIFGTIKHLGLDRTGYKLVNNGAVYNHFEHEHFHILGGSDKEPGGTT
jgi:histidine triad (HIT) family protein